MNKTEIGQFTTMWLSMAELHGITLSENAIALACDILRDHGLESIGVACKEHLADRNSGNYMPKPSQIIHRINCNRKREQFYKRLEAQGQVKNYTARNKCIHHIKELLPTFRAYEDRQVSNEGHPANADEVLMYPDVPF